MSADNISSSGQWVIENYFRSIKKASIPSGHNQWMNSSQSICGISGFTKMSADNISSSGQWVIQNYFRSIKKASIPSGHNQWMNSSQSICGICMEGKLRHQMFINKGKCSHNTFCIECINKHVAAKVEGGITVITCPEPSCKATFEPDICQGIITNEVFEMWNTALFRSLYSGSKTVNCPFEDCTSEMCVENNNGEGGLLIKKAECPCCHRLFCAQCKVPWHFKMRCEKFCRMKKEDHERMQALEHDMIFLRLAEEKKWRTCPKCKFYVQKLDGCLHITCRCKFEFCYGCGSKWSVTHSGCQG